MFSEKRVSKYGRLTVGIYQNIFIPGGTAISDFVRYAWVYEVGKQNFIENESFF
jgi:hypothetical protein